ncbi:MAG: epoxide hydrolase [Novosphingobium sp.]
MRPFTVKIPDEALDDVRRRLVATRWIGDVAGDAPGYGASLSFTRGLADYWLHGFDWRALEARINAQPQILTEIDGLQIHAIHRPSSRPNAIPLLMIHGWPSSFLEFLDVCEALAEPKGDAPAFHVVVPSLPGHGFSSTRPGTSPRVIAAIFAELMTKLGYQRFLIQGANWGSSIGTEMAREWPDQVIGLHLNSVNASPPPPEAGVVLSPADQAMADTYVTLLGHPHFNLVSQTPFTPAHALNDSPAGLAAWIGEKLLIWADRDMTENPGLSPEWMVGTVALYWFTGTAGTAHMLYREAVNDPVPERFVTVPTAVAHFARELVMAPRPWAERQYNIARWTSYGHGGHFAAIEVPDLFLGDVRSFAAELCGSGEAG